MCFRGRGKHSQRPVKIIALNSTSGPSQDRSHRNIIFGVLIVSRGGEECAAVLSFPVFLK
jgi:hypothetical protein